MRVKLCVEYDGASFSGWQVQPGQRTVQSELENAISVYLSSLAKEQTQGKIEPPRTTASGRTDAGVHARNQVVSFDWPEELEFDSFRFAHSINGISDKALRIKSAEIVDQSFDARRSSHKKCYSYSFIQGHSPIDNPRVLSIPQKLDIPSMIEAAKLIAGTHDFKSFQASDCAASTTIRTILASELVYYDSGIYRYYVIGNGFLKQMVRTIMGTLIEVGLKKREAKSILEIIEAKDRKLAGPVVEAKGLTLEWVKYD